jgi:hypothetical protein
MLSNSLLLHPEILPFITELSSGIPDLSEQNSTVLYSGNDYRTEGDEMKTNTTNFVA